VQISTSFTGFLIDEVGEWLEALLADVRVAPTSRMRARGERVRSEHWLVRSDGLRTMAAQ